MKLHPHISRLGLAAIAAATVITTGAFAFSFRLSALTEQSFAQAQSIARSMPAAPEVKGATEATAPEKPAPDVSPFALPISDAARRVTKKPFGIEIHPETSPVPNDHFNGYHVGVDFETFPEEAEIDVPIYAICRGPLLFKKQAKGYGGVAVQGCRIGGEEVSVVYGHLNVASVSADAGEELMPGQFVGNLGKGHSQETDGVRKHLHLGIRKGRTLDIRGYVPKTDETEHFLDAMQYLSR